MPIKDPIKLKEYQLQYRIKHGQKRRYKLQGPKKRRYNLNYKLADNLRRRLRYALNGKYKTAKTLELLGCSVDYLKNHLQSQFQHGMNWSNYGKWHIDHIKPCASFDLSKPEEQSKCFSWKNLQPLWAIDNLRKSKT